MRIYKLFLLLTLQVKKWKTSLVDSYCLNSQDAPFINIWVKKLINKDLRKQKYMKREIIH